MFFEREQGQERSLRLTFVKPAHLSFYQFQGLYTVFSGCCYCLAMELVLVV